MDQYEWGTQPPFGGIIKWKDEFQARSANAMSCSFPDGEHVLVKRKVGEWEVVPVSD